MKTIFAGAIAGMLLAIAAYAVLVVIFVIASPGLMHRTSFTARLVVTLGVAVAGIWYAFRVARRHGDRRAIVGWVTTTVLIGVSFFALYLYPLWFAEKPSDDWKKLRQIASEVTTANGSEVKLPAGYSYAIVRARSGEAERLTIHVSDRLVGRVMGVDLSKLDYVAVEIAGGKVRRAWVDYF
jgi:hypothetical protein